MDGPKSGNGRISFLSTPSARRATRHRGRVQTRQDISIHALREEGDRQHRRHCPESRNFYPRPPRGGRHSSRGAWKAENQISIHALREEGDCRLLPPGSRILHFYPRPPRGGRPQTASHWTLTHRISIHALREEGDTALCCLYCQQDKFLSTPSARRATSWSVRRISQMPSNFYPRPPRGGRLGLRYEGDNAKVFLSTPSARRATVLTFGQSAGTLISIHALREEGDAGLYCRME